ncbi:N-acetylglucosamine-6-O-sulfatase [Dyadobacter sp. CECT 9275]|uniref:N-acetylglucosamine-6-O-sulfatase n=1 Tax=Dyadobacter helix TaxID=2822344 RepID=A0A916NDG2_9BACT|nr:sulfatase [Dyadobacter sp. CECT 9275]CAG5010602.1 N-acetylglucosamine-6-O-sulfatase [Dyadobacter sp. CECT 9275]
MKIGSILLSGCAVGLLVIFGFSGKQPRTQKDSVPRQPNVVIILTDDQRWDALGVAGNQYLKTPNIDKLAAEGVFFKNYFCTTSLCSPSRASILSGVYAHTHGVVNNFTDFPLNRPNMPAVLQSAGYETAYIGKWHMGEENDSPRPGFDFFVTHKGQGKYWDTEFNINGQGSKEIKGYYTNVVTKLATDWLGTRKSKPFFLMLGHKAPHSFYTPEPKYAHAFENVPIPYPQSAFELTDKPAWIEQRLTTWHGIYGPLFEWRKKFPDASPEAVKDFEKMIHAYWATILSVDDSVGEIYRTLQEMGELDNTIFIFTSDNGLLNGEHGMVDKRTMHEPSIHIPLIVRFPGLTPVTRPVVVNKQVLTLDLAPSVLDLCGAPALPKIHGQSFKRLVQGDTTHWRKAWYYEYNYEKQFPYTPNVRGIRTDEWKYIHYPTGDGQPDKHLAELYHLAADPEENHNLIHDRRYARQLKKLKTELNNLLKQTGAYPDSMPLDEGVKSQLPEKSIR